MHRIYIGCANHKLLFYCINIIAELNASIDLELAVTFDEKKTYFELFFLFKFKKFIAIKTEIIEKLVISKCVMSILLVR